MAHVSSNPLRHSDLYNRIEDWITESDAAQNGYEAQDTRSSLLHRRPYLSLPAFEALSAPLTTYSSLLLPTTGVLCL